LQIDALYIDQKIADDEYTRFILRRLKIPATIVHDASSVYRIFSNLPDSVSYGKKTLYLTYNKGEFIRNCPGTRNYRCCNYKILHIGTYCNMDCSYCILQTYFHPPLLQFFVNFQDLRRQVGALFSTKAVFRIGTGEYTDSLIWEPWTDFSKRIVPLFSEQSYAVLELKTKTAFIQNLARLRHNRKTIVAWSLNTEKVISQQEKNTASLDSRLQAAKQCESWGYPLAFHFDPLIIYEGCEADYLAIVERLFSAVSGENVAWVSLGAFRYLPSLKTIIQRRFPESDIVYGEFISGLDDKMRYFKPLRIDLFRKIVSGIRDINPSVTIYLCMESDEVWQKTLGFVPRERGGLAAMLDESAVSVCGLTRGNQPR